MGLDWTDDISRQVEVGDRIKLVTMPDDPNPIESGSEGSVISVDTRSETIGVKWDNGRTLNLVQGVDVFDILNEGGSDKAIINKSMPKPTLRGNKSSDSGKALNKSFKKELQKGKIKDIKIESEEVVGGKADGLTPQDLADKHEVSVKDIQKELEIGLEIEMEHTSDPMVAKEIVLDHLSEFPDYYSNKEHGLVSSEKGLEGDLMENFFGGMGNMWGKKQNKDDQYDLKKLANDLKRITSTIKTSDTRHEETIVTMIENFRDKYSEHSMIDTMIKSLYQEVRELGQEIDEMTGAAGSSGAFSTKLESKIIKVSELVNEITTTVNSGKYDDETKSPFDSNKDGWFWNDKPWYKDGEIVDAVAQLDTNWKDKLITLTKEELIKTVRVLEGKKVTEDEEELDETMTATASGQYQGPMFAAKDDDSWNMGKKPIWKGGTIVQKVKNSGVLTESGISKSDFDDIYSRMYDKMFNQVCRKYTKDNDKAQEYCQEGFIKVWKNIDKYEATGSLEGWVRFVIQNTILDIIRKEKKMKFVDNSDDGFDFGRYEQPDYSPQELSKSMSDVREALSQLSPQYQKVFTLYYMDGLKHDEIAEELGISIGTSKSNLSKAKKNIQQLLGKGIYQESVLDEINKVKYNKDGDYVKFKKKCVEYNNGPHCSQGAIDDPLILSKTTSDNITEVAKKLGISEKEVKKTVIKRLSR